MDMETTMKSAGLSAGIISALGGIWLIIKKFNNKRFHSNCCGKDMDVILAVNDITEAEKKPTPRSSPRTVPISDSTKVPPIDLEK